MGTVRATQFLECVDEIARHLPSARRIIDGAVWEIERNPKGFGIYLSEIDVWQARLVLAPEVEVLLLYCITRRFVMMLTIIPTDEFPY